MPARVQRLFAAWLCTGFLFGAAACKRSPKPAPAPEKRATAPASSREKQPARCRKLPGFELRLKGSATQAAAKPSIAEHEPSDEPADDASAAEPANDGAAALPFGIDIGGASATGSGFALAGLRGDAAFVARLSASGSQVVELGRVHGDPEAPVVATAGERVLVVLPNSDAAGRTLRIGELSPASASVSFGPDLTGLGRAAASVGLAISGERALLVLAREDEDGSRVLSAALSLGDLRAPLALSPLSNESAEMPRVVAREGGFWVAWVRNIDVAAPPAAPPKPGADVDGHQPFVFGPRVLEVARLDLEGKLVGTPRRLGEPRPHALLYDIAPLASGGLTVATRTDAAAPGAESGAISLWELGADGSQSERRLDDDDIGAGAPALLHEARRAPNAPQSWLAVSSRSGATRLGSLEGERTTLRGEPALGSGEVLAVSEGKLLIQHARGRGTELSVLDCGGAGK
jgi:hypothetical protein